MNLLNKYKWILFDADDTLFHFDAFAGLKLMFSRYEIEFAEHHYNDYQTLNKQLWVEYQNGRITAQQLQHKRFETWANNLTIAPSELQNAYMLAMAEVCLPNSGAEELLQFLHGKLKLGIITNGFIALQEKRLEHTGFKKYFDLLVISEQVGIAKPHPDIFNYALGQMGNIAPGQVLMVGDNPDSDIIGGLNVGMDTCWLNADNKLSPEGIRPHYQIASLTELAELLSRQH